MKVLLLAPSYDAGTPGESWSTYKWVQGISDGCETTVLTQHRRGWDPLASPVNAKRVVNWHEPDLPGMRGRIAWELKPGYLAFYFRARRWIRQAIVAGDRFDLVHQINPLALRYPCPAAGLGLKYLVGPLAGSLPTPEAFRKTTPERQWYRKLRAIDVLRLKYDPWLRRTYTQAEIVLGVAPYVKDLLSPCPPKRFEIMAETGVEKVSSASKLPPAAGEPLRLLFVGRIIRTKGIIEAIHAVAEARKTCRLQFDILGTGDLEPECRRLIQDLQLGDIVTLHGRRPRSEVFAWYDRSHAFLFPSYREPSGNVVFEAMSRGLPVIAANAGGPGHVVTAEAGFTAPVTTPVEFQTSIVAAIKALLKPEQFSALSAGALETMRKNAIWDSKLTRIRTLYEHIIGT